MGERDVVDGTLKYASPAVEKLEGECERCGNIRPFVDAICMTALDSQLLLTENRVYVRRGVFGKNIIIITCDHRGYAVQCFERKKT